MPNGKLEASSDVLMRLGVEEVVARAYAALRDLGAQVTRDKVSRVDVCCDLPGRTIAPLKAAYDAGHYVSRARHGDEHLVEGEYKEHDYSAFRVCRAPTSFNLGRGDVRMRTYDKVEECRYKPSKLQILMDHRWGGYPVDAIRVEFQLRRQKLRMLGIDSFADWLAKRASVVHYLTHDWMRLTDGPVDRKHPDRTAVLTEWQEVQGAFASWAGAGPLVDLSPIPTQPMPADRYVKSIVGLWISLFARSGVEIQDNEMFVHEGLCRMLDELKGRDMVAEIRRRVLELGLLS